jgi:osmotically-inducible protein OsmY
MMHWMKWSLGFIAASLLSGCGILAVGAVTGTTTIMADRRSPGVQAIDLWIQLEAANHLAKRYGDNAHITVTSFNQKVLLTGEAKDAEIKGGAGAYVQSLKNVRTVFNEIVIGPNSSFTARASDAYLASRIKTQMIFTNDLPSNSMNIVVEAGNVYLIGILTKEEAERAKKVASMTSGVKQVFVFFDIISNAEKLRLEQQGKAETSQPDTNVNN